MRKLIRSALAVSKIRQAFATLPPNFQSYAGQNANLRIDRSSVAILHRQGGRIIVRHSLEESCECCEILNGQIETEGKKENEANVKTKSADY